MIIDGKFGILDFTLSQIKFTHFGINTDGSSIDDGNNKLYPDNVFEFRQVNDKYHSNLRNKVI